MDTTFIIYSLQHLCEIMSSNQKIMAFFAAIPGYTYQWARYSDWMEPEWDEFEEKEAKKTYKNQNLLDACKIGRRLFRPYQEYIAKIDGTTLKPLAEEIANA